MERVRTRGRWHEHRLVPAGSVVTGTDGQIAVRIAIDDLCLKGAFEARDRLIVLHDRELEPAAFTGIDRLVDEAYFHVVPGHAAFLVGEDRNGRN